MLAEQYCINTPDQIQSLEINFEPNLLLLFMASRLENPTKYTELLAERFPGCTIFGCSTSGEICQDQVFDNTLSLTAVRFEKTTHKIACVDIEESSESYAAGEKLFEQLNAPDLKHLIVLSDGLNVNGADLVEGLKKNNNQQVSITGGLAGDGAAFEKTFVIAGKDLYEKKVVGVGLYGSALKVGYGSKGGWDSFGLERLVTKSDKNVLYELDGKPALELYKSFLGDKAKELPGSGLLFPLSMRDEDNQLPVVRTILAVDEKTQSLTFAGNIPKGSYVRLMKANVDRVINGAEQSAQVSAEMMDVEPVLSILISCVGRKLVLKQMVEEEVEAVRAVVGNNAANTGFYSYGEIAPFGDFSPCQLHNQTMTITTFAE